MALTQKEQDYVDTNYADTDVATAIKDALSVGDDLNGVTATAAELNLNDGAVAGTAVASKTLALDANRAADTLRTADLQLGTSGSETAVTSTGAELNLLDESNTEPSDGAFAAVMRVAKAEWDFAVDGGAISAIDLNVDIPDNAVIVMASVDVLTTCTSSGDSGTGAISVEGANDVVTAIAIDDGGNPWDVGIGPLIVVDPVDASTHVKTTSAQAVTLTIAVEAFTAGKFNVYLFYVISE